MFALGRRDGSSWREWCVKDKELAAGLGEIGGQEHEWMKNSPAMDAGNKKIENNARWLVTEVKNDGESRARQQPRSDRRRRGILRGPRYAICGTEMVDGTKLKQAREPGVQNLSRRRK